MHNTATLLRILYWF